MSIYRGMDAYFFSITFANVRQTVKFFYFCMNKYGYISHLICRTNDHYQWNKVTTCVHNLFSGQRWADQYGEMIITEENGDATCKLTFVKVSPSFTLNGN